MKLYELTEAYQRLLDANEDGEFDAALSALGGELDGRVESLAKVVRSLEAEAEVYGAEAERLKDRQAAAIKRAQDLKDYLLGVLLTLDRTSVKGQLVTVSMHASPPRCDVLDAEAVPVAFRKVVPETWQPDKGAIIAHWKASGEQVPGAQVRQGKHVRIR